MWCHLLDGEFLEKDVPILQIEKMVRNNMALIHDMTLADAITLFDALGRELLREPKCRSLDGLSYISMWLRRSNLERLVVGEYGDIKALDRFIPTPFGWLKAQPRGVVCHWVANNVATLGFYSMMVAFLSKNASIIKASSLNKHHLLTILDMLNDVVIEKDGTVLRGSDLVKCVAVVTFDGRDEASSRALSLAGDCKMVWGGADSVRAITSLPQREGCEVLVFGPKYSLAVLDRDITPEEAVKGMRLLARDIVLFDQMACSSPQVIFVERGGISLEDVVQMMAQAFSDLPAGVLEITMPEELCASVINKRGEYLLDEVKEIRSAPDLSWTILIDGEDGLPDPVHGRCVFIREVDDIMELARRLTRKVQVVEVLFGDKERLNDFADLATRSGADRLVLPGKAHNFTLPWDGMKPLSRLVRWVTIV